MPRRHLSLNIMPAATQLTGRDSGRHLLVSLVPSFLFAFLISFSYRITDWTDIGSRRYRKQKMKFVNLDLLLQSLEYKSRFWKVDHIFKFCLSNMFYLHLSDPNNILTMSLKLGLTKSATFFLFFFILFYYYVRRNIGECCSLVNYE